MKTAILDWTAKSIWDKDPYNGLWRRPFLIERRSRFEMMKTVVLEWTTKSIWDKDPYNGLPLFWFLGRASFSLPVPSFVARGEKINSAVILWRLAGKPFWSPAWIPVWSSDWISGLKFRLNFRSEQWPRMWTVILAVNSDWTYVKKQEDEDGRFSGERRNRFSRQTLIFWIRNIREWRWVWSGRRHDGRSIWGPARRSVQGAVDGSGSFTRILPCNLASTIMLSSHPKKG